MVKGKVSSVCEFGAESGDEIVRWLLIDDGLTSRKRRNTLLNPAFKYAGIGTALHSQFGVVTVIILAEDVISLGKQCLTQLPLEGRDSTSSESRCSRDR